jgi:hypothetical protein
MIAGFQATSLLIIKLAGRFLPQTLEDVQDRRMVMKSSGCDGRKRATRWQLI